MTDAINGISDPNRIDRDINPTHSNSPVQKAITRLPMPPEDASPASFGPLPRPAKLAAAPQRATYFEPATALAPNRVQAQMDAFRVAATPTFRAEGRDVSVPLAFRMTVDAKLTQRAPASALGWIAQERTVQSNEYALQRAAAKVGLLGEVSRLYEGRATPEVVRRVTQELIDEGRLPPSPPSTLTLELRIRMMMCGHGIGMDCSGYAQQAFLESRGLHRGQTKLGSIENEDLGHLDKKGFTRVDIHATRPGDIVSFESLEPKEPGHRAIVYERRDATPEELEALRKQPEFSSGRVTVLMLDSSWGSGANFAEGGVQRRTFWYCEQTRTWAERTTSLGAPQAFAVRPEEDLYPDHTLVGAFRPSGEAR